MLRQVWTAGALLLVTIGNLHAADEWHAKLVQDLPALGHRNWIVIADSAYPLQNSPGIKLLVTEAPQLEVVKGVLESLAAAKHVRPKILLDAELPFVDERDAPGIDAYRDDLDKLLKEADATSVPHENIIAQLGEAGEAYRVLVIKTPLALPYTSVFIELECGYWSDTAEKRLRSNISQAGPRPKQQPKE